MHVSILELLRASFHNKVKLGIQLMTCGGQGLHGILEAIMLTLEHKIDRAQRLLRMIEEDAPLLAVRVAPLSADHQKSVRSYAQRLAERTRAEIAQLLHEKTLLGAVEESPSAAD